MASNLETETGVKLEDFLAMWRLDGTRLVEQDRRSIDSYLWLLYSVYFSDSTYDYGRHMALLLKVDEKTQVILAHDVENLSGDVINGGHRSVQEWFDKHAGKY